MYSPFTSMCAYCGNNNMNHSGRVKIKSKDKDKKPKIDVFKVIESRFKNRYL